MWFVWQHLYKLFGLFSNICTGDVICLVTSVQMIWFDLFVNLCRSDVNKNVNVYVYSLDIPFSRVQQTAQFTPLVSELTLIRSHLLWGEFSAFSAANDISQCHFTFHNSPFFSFHQVPITAGWTEAVWYERFCPTPLHTSNCGLLATHVQVIWFVCQHL